MILLTTVVSKQFATVTSKHVYSVGPAVGKENCFNPNEVCRSRNNSGPYRRVCALGCILISVRNRALPSSIALHRTQVYLAQQQQCRKLMEDRSEAGSAFRQNRCLLACCLDRHAWPEMQFGLLHRPGFNLTDNNVLCPSLFSSPRLCKHCLLVSQRE